MLAQILEMECDWLTVQKNVAFELVYVDLEKDNDALKGQREGCVE